MTGGCRGTARQRLAARRSGLGRQAASLIRFGSVGHGWGNVSGRSKLPALRRHEWAVDYQPSRLDRREEVGGLASADAVRFAGELDPEQRGQPRHARPGRGGLAQCLASRVAPLVVSTRVVRRRAEAVAGGVDHELSVAEEIREFSTPPVALSSGLAVGDVDREALGVLDAGAQQALGSARPPRSATSPSRRLVASPVAALDRPPRRRPSRSARPPRRRSSRRVRRRLLRSSKWPRRPSGRPSRSARQPWRPAARRASRRVRIRPHRAVDRATDRHRAAQATGRPPAAPSAARVVRNPRTTTANSSRALWCFRWTGEWQATDWKERPDKRPHLTPGRHRQWPRVPTAMLSRRPSCIRPVQLVPASSSPLEAVLGRPRHHAIIGSRPFAQHRAFQDGSSVR